MISRPDAVETVARRAALERAEAISRLEAVLPARTPDLRDAWAAGFGTAGRITLNFHPDRKTLLGGTVAEGLCEHGWYFSQFKTGISSGSRSAIAGGERDNWEQRLFDGAYRDVEADGHRPVYGSFDLLADPHGGSPRFGSSFVVLKPHVRERTTLCIGDSHAGPRDVGTSGEPFSLLAGLCEQAVVRNLLDRPLGLDDLLAALGGQGRSGPPSRVLDGYIEAQVHGGVNLADDVESVMLDPSFRNTPTAAHVQLAADRYAFTLGWHGGSELAASDVPADFRTPETPLVARRVARDDGIVDAAAIGRAASDIAPEVPTATGDAPDSDLQQLKYLWHAVLALGHDAQVM